MPLSSLPSDDGIGNLYECSFKFIDYLKDVGAKIWQLLPLNPIGPGNSPYQSLCGEAIDPIYISLKFLKENGYIKDYVTTHKNNDRVNFNEIKKYKEHYFKKAYLIQKDTKTKEFKEFVKENKWLTNFALFSILFEKNKKTDWNYWKKEEKYAPYQKNLDLSKYNEKILYIEWLQFIAYKEFNLFKEYAKKKDIKLMGDLPFYVGFNSSDCFSNQDNFLLDEKDKANFVAGVAPDYFNDLGQKRGNPVYDWEFLRSDNFSFLINRIYNIGKMYDYLRLDHFRAFASYYIIPFDKDARSGEWKKSYGDEFFFEFMKEHNDINLVAEDLGGENEPDVIALKKKYNFKGMAVLENCIFNKDLNISENTILYTGTHDNLTLVGWVDALSSEEKEMLEIVLRYSKVKGETIEDKMINFVLSSKSEIVIIPIQDYLKLDNTFRMNSPGTMNDINWSFRLKDYSLMDKSKTYIKNLIKEYNR